MSPLPGDAPAHDGATLVREPGVFFATSPILERPLAIPKEGAFRVHLDDREAFGEGTYRTSLAVRIVEPEVSASASWSDDVVASGTFAALRSARSIGNDSAAEAIERQLETASNLSLTNLADAVLHRVCADQSNTDYGCNVYGDYGRGTAIRACMTRPGNPLNPIAPRVRDTGLCTTYSPANVTYLAAGEGDAILRPPVRNATNAIAQAPPAEPGGWSDFVLDATPSARWAQDDDTFVAPAGTRIQVRISTTYDGPGLGASAWSLGRADARSALTIRLEHTPPFGEMAWTAENIGPGPHTGSFSRPGETDDYAFVAQEGQFVSAWTTTPGVHLSTFSPSGRLLPGSSTVSESGRHVLRVAQSGSGLPPPQEYRFRLDVGKPASGAVPLADGTVTGHLDAARAKDAYVFHAERFQTFRLRLDHEEGTRLSLHVNASSVTYEQDATSIVAEGYRSSDGPVNVTVARYGGESSYALTLWRDPAMSLAGRPQLQMVWAANGSRPASAVHALDAAPEGAVRAATPQGIYRVSPEGSTLELARAVSELAHDNAGRVIVSEGERIVKPGDASDAGSLARSGGGDFEIGPDGSVYSSGWFPDAGGGILRTTPEREETFLPMKRPLAALEFAPDATLYALDAPQSSIVRVDPTDGNTTPVFSTLSGVTSLAFDLAGRAYASTPDGRVLRFDPATGAPEVVAVGPRGLADLTFSGTRLYATAFVWNATGHFPDRQAVFMVDLGTPGFEGFAQAQPFVAAPDLVIVKITEERVPTVKASGASAQTEPAETRLMHVTLRNDGGSPVRHAFDILLLQACQPCTPSRVAEARAVEAPLGPGESRTVSIPWSTAGHAGRIHLQAIADPHLAAGFVVESNETNNARAFETYVVHPLAETPR